MMARVLGITDLSTYLLGTVAIVLLPGPNSLFVLTTAARRGVATGYRAAGGVFVGDAVLMAVSATGAASLLRAYPPLFLVLKYAGGAYLGYLGVNMLRGAWRRWRTRHDPAAPRLVDAGTATIGGPGAVGGPTAERNPFRRALTISLLNPKAILFFISFFVQFVDPTYRHPTLSFLLLGAIATVTSALYLTVLIFAGTFLAGQFQQRRRLAAGATTAVGALFLGFSLKLVTASVS